MNSSQVLLWGNHEKMRNEGDYSQAGTSFKNAVRDFRSEQEVDRRVWTSYNLEKGLQFEHADQRRSEESKGRWTRTLINSEEDLKRLEEEGPTPQKKLQLSAEPAAKEAAMERYLGKQCADLFEHANGARDLMARWKKDKPPPEGTGEYVLQRKVEKNTACMPESLIKALGENLKVLLARGILS